MSYFSQVSEGARRFFHSFSYQYVPPDAECDGALKLSSAISECSNQGKLLVVHLTKCGKKVPIDIRLPEEDFLVFTAPFNSKSAFEISRFFNFSSLPFAGLFYCPTTNHLDIQMVDKIVDQEDLLRASVHFRTLSPALYEKRNLYVANTSHHNIVDEQDHAYNEVLREMQEKESAELKKAEEEKKKANEEKTRIEDAKRRFDSLPPEPPSGTPNRVTIRFNLPSGGPKIRSFLSSDKVRCLFDFVDVIGSPQKTIISFGFPPKTITNLENTIKDEGLSRMETVFVEFEHFDD